ncbi:hypothetical protein JHD46_02070 [Sulfurimonas sp. SAG-AH-194-C20]|nr:hypothetical protein [Sulfurimonas sp. SAG-AH-194-C20]MDF1878422.1 hypothetical protein [Sulfurimonas sp. SAG-AH-194-C20]
MPLIIEHIDKIARDKQRDVIFIEFDREVYPSYDYEKYEECIKLLEWLESHDIAYRSCGPIAREDGWESYRGELYLDIPFDRENEKYQLICEHMDNPDGSFKIQGVNSWIFPLEVALKNKHHDEEGFWDKWAENF